MSLEQKFDMSMDVHHSGAHVKTEAYYVEIYSPTELVEELKQRKILVDPQDALQIVEFAQNQKQGDKKLTVVPFGTKFPEYLSLHTVGYILKGESFEIELRDYAELSANSSALGSGVSGKEGIKCKILVENDDVHLLTQLHDAVFSMYSLSLYVGKNFKKLTKTLEEAVRNSKKK